MGWAQTLSALHEAFIAGGGSISSHTYDTFPDNDDIALTAHATADTWGDWVAVATSVGAASVWFCGYYVGNVAPVTLGAALDAKIDFGTGASGSETSRAVFPYHKSTGLTTTEGLVGAFYTVPFPIHVPSGTREAGRVKGGAAAADILSVVEHHAIGLRK